MSFSDANDTKYEKCYNQILQYITDQSLTIDNKLPTEQQFTEMLGVSRITIRHAISRLEEQGIVKKVQGSGTFIQKLPGNNSSTTHIPLILPQDTSDLELLNALRGAEKCLAEHSYNLATHFIHENPEEERNTISKLIENGAKCIMIFPHDESKNYQFFSQVEHNGIRLIFLDRISRHVSGCFVGCDNVKGGYLATCHLIQRGYRRIAFLNKKSRTESAAITNRLLGYQDALAEYHLPYNEDYVTFNDDNENMDILVNKLLQLPSPPDAIFCATDLTAVDAIFSLNKCGIYIPNDIGIIGFDNSCILQHLPFSLSTVDQSFYDIGYEAAQIACDILSGKLSYNLHKIMPVKLIERGSTRHMD